MTVKTAAGQPCHPAASSSTPIVSDRTVSTHHSVSRSLRHDSVDQPFRSHCRYSGDPPPSFLGSVCAQIRPLSFMAHREKKMSEEQPILEVQRRWVEALVKADTAALDVILVDSSVETDESGCRVNKPGTPA